MFRRSQIGGAETLREAVVDRLKAGDGIGRTALIARARLVAARNSQDNAPCRRASSSACRKRASDLSAAEGVPCNNKSSPLRRSKALDSKTKELIALGIAVAIRCDACVAFHAESAVKRGATREEVMETMGMAIYMGAGPSVMYAAKAVEAFDQFAARK